MSKHHSSQSPRRKVTRRAFVGSAAAAFTIMKTSTALGSAANSKIEAGIIGLGGRGRMITSMVRDHGGYDITAVADYFPELAEGVGEQFDVPKTRRFSGLMGYRKLIESGVDAVFLETPPYCFPDHVTAAVNAGSHVYMAKPVACDVPGCLTVAEMANKATAAEKVFLVDFQTRTEPLNIEGIERLDQDQIGDIGLLSSVYNDEGFPDPPFTKTIESRLRGLVWVNDVAVGGSYLVNAGIHAIDVALWMAGGATPISAVGASRTARPDAHGDSRDVYSVTYEFENGLILNHRGEHLKNRQGFQCDCTAFCTSGHLVATYDGAVIMQGSEGDWPGGEVKGLYQRGARINIATFHENVTEGIADNPTVEPSINANLATILGREAAERGTKVTWKELIAENKRIAPDLSGLKA